MARSWSLVDTLSNSAADPPNYAVNNDASKWFFIDSTKLKVISWDGTTETDISGSTWSGNNVVQDLCWFSGTLYAAVDDDPGANYDAYIYSYDGTGQSWTLEFTVADGGTSYRFETGGNEERLLAADDDRIVAQAVPGTAVERLFASTDGSSWTIQTVDGGTDFEPRPYCRGTYETELTEVFLAALDPGTDQRVINYDGLNDWALLSASSIGLTTVALVGYADGKTFWNDGSYVQYSTDYGVNRTNTSIAEGTVGDTRIHYMADDAIMLRVSNTAYVWDSGSNDFVADGTTGSDSIFGFFAINNTLYALCAGNKIYGGGSLGPIYALTHSADGIPGGVLV